MSNIHMISKCGKNNLYERNTLPKGSQWKHGFPIKLLTFQEQSENKETLMCEVKKAIKKLLIHFNIKILGQKQLVIYVLMITR